MMPLNSVTRRSARNGGGRKRAFPTSSRRTWKTVSALTLSASFVATIAFQHNPPVSHHNPLLSTTRSSTAMFVLADPTNLVIIESKQSVENRATLEELFLLSSLAKKATRKKSSGIIETKPVTRLASAAVTKGEKTNTSKPVRKIRSNSIKVPKSTVATDTAITTIEDGEKTGTIRKASITDRTKRSKLHSKTTSTQISGNVKPSRKVAFKGLTTVPNPRNQKKKKPLIGTLTERLAMSEDEYIRNILQKKEDLLSYEPNEQWDPISNAAAEDASLDARILAPEYTKIRELNSRRPDTDYTTTLSTMPGYLERRNTSRAKAHSDGQKVVERNSNIELVKTSKSKQNSARKNGQAMYKTTNSVPDSLVQFANDIHNVDRITPEEEIMLGEQAQEALRVQNIYDSLATKLKREPTDDEWCAASGKLNMEAVSQIIEEGVEAKNKLVTSNLRIVQAALNVYIRNGMQERYNAGDMMQEGIIALIRAAEKFDPSKGFRFSTYALYWIRAAMKRDLDFQSQILRSPQKVHDLHKKISKIRKELAFEFDREPNKLELCDAAGVSVAQLERCETFFSLKMFSLEQTLDNKNRNYSKGNMKKDDFHSVTSSRLGIECSDVELMELREDLLRAMDLHLSEEEATVIKLKFGMDDKCDSFKKVKRSFVDVAEMIGVKPDSVRRSMKSGLKKLEMFVGDDFRYYNRDFCI